MWPFATAENGHLLPRAKTHPFHCPAVTKQYLRAEERCGADGAEVCWAVKPLSTRSCWRTQTNASTERPRIAWHTALWGGTTWGGSQKSRPAREGDESTPTTVTASSALTWTANTLPPSGLAEGTTTPQWPRGTPSPRLPAMKSPIAVDHRRNLWVKSHSPVALFRVPTGQAIGKWVPSGQ